MKIDQKPVVNPREAQHILQELLKRRPAYLPGWRSSEKDPGQALLQIFARYVEVVIERLNQAPDKNLFAFLDLLGINLISAQSARAPVVFTVLPGSLNSRVEAGTRLGAETADRSEAVVFETERDIALVAAKLVEVKTVWPARDEYADHTVAYTGGRSITLYDSRKAVAHELYVAHDTLFAFKGKATIEIEIELATFGNKPLDLVWEHWDGQIWRPFKVQDGTDHLKRSGTISLKAECGRSVQKMVFGIKAHWIRGLLEHSLPPDPTRILPTIDRIGLRAVVSSHSGVSGEGSDTGLLPDYAFAEGSQLDITKEFYPFGRSPERDSAFYFTSLDIFSKPGAEVTVRFKRAITVEDEADQESERFYGDVNHAREVLEAALKEAANGVADAANKALTVLKDDPKKPNEPVDVLKTALTALTKAIAKFPDKSVGDFQVQIGELVKKVNEVVTALKSPTLKRVDPKKPGSAGSNPCGPVTDFAIKKIKEYHDAAIEFASFMDDILKTEILVDNKWVDGGLASLGPFPATIAAGTPKATLQPPSLLWEYWNGTKWRVFRGPSDKDEENLWISEPSKLKIPAETDEQPFEVSFKVPADMQISEENGIDALWMRIRIERGNYKRLRLVSWYDPEAGKINFFPLIEPRPPALAEFQLNYVYRSTDASGPHSTQGDQAVSSGGSSIIQPEHCLSYNDFSVELHSQDVSWPGNFFAPFRPVADVTPALYLGFDRPLPNDLVSLYLDLEECETKASSLVWECWNNEEWRELSVTDETNNLSKPGMLSFIAPKIAVRPQLDIERARDTQIVVRDALAVNIFQPGNRIVVLEAKSLELATVTKIEGDVISVQTPLRNTYSGGTVSLAALPRFGNPRDWIRARLRVDGKPSKAHVQGIYPNAVWAVQRQTIENETIGSGSGVPDQTVYFSQAPVLPGEAIEIRELEGARAAVEYPILKDELLKEGFAEADIRRVTDPATGRIAEVWVRWRPCDHLVFSGPEDRHYMIERARGRLIFGNGRNGRLPTVAANNVRVRRYQTGGGRQGNVEAGAITQLMSAVSNVQAVFNPRAADGGADGELLAEVKSRGPQTLRHRWCAVSASDYEALAREASPGVAAARALPTTAANGRPAPGWVTVLIAPESDETQPQPSRELRERVHAYLAVRCPATVTRDRIAVIGPKYLLVGVAATAAARKESQVGTVKEWIIAKITAFLHPRTGGPDGCGWPFGRNVYLSDLAAVVESLPGVDYAERLELLLDGTPQGEWVEVPPDRIVASGSIRLEMIKRG